MDTCMFCFRLTCTSQLQSTIPKAHFLSSTIGDDLGPEECNCLLQEVHACLENVFQFMIPAIKFLIPAQYS